MRTGKKVTVEPLAKKRLTNKLIKYLQNQEKALQQYGQTLEEYASSIDMNTYFKSIHLHLTKSMIQEANKNTYIQDGIYILLQGSLIHVWTKHKSDKERRFHLFSLASNGIFSNLNENYSDRLNLLAYGYSILINSAFAVVQAEGNNLLTNQDCLLINIPKRVIQSTDFFRLAEQRKQAFYNSKFPGIRHFSLEPLVNMNFQIHHTFRIRKIGFRNTFQIMGLGVILQGASKIKSNTQNVIQFSQNSLLFSQFQYQVSSSQIKILQICKNPTIVFKNRSLVNQFIESVKQNNSPNQQLQQKTNIEKYRGKIAKSIYLNKQCRQKTPSQKQKRKKRRQFGSFSKESQHFCIVPLQICEQNLNMIKSHNKKIMLNNCKKPLILFNLSKKQNFESTTENNDLDINQSTNTFRIKSKISLPKAKLMERYQQYAKTIYNQFRRYQSNQSENYDKLTNKNIKRKCMF